VAIIWPCRLSVEQYAAAGREVAVPRPCCGCCGVAMMFWSGYWRSVRCGGVVWPIWVRRCRCRPCRRTDAVLPSFCLRRRLDAAGVIGPAIVAVGAGSGTRTVAGGIGEWFAYTTVRGWWRRHRERVEWLAGMLVAGWGQELWPSGTEMLAALTGLFGGLGLVMAGTVGLDRWGLVSLLSGGGWLSPSANTDALTTDGRGWSWMAVMGLLSPTRAEVPP
jgi:hypothetical protein